MNTRKKVSGNMDINIARDFLKNNPVFWSRLGFCYDPPLKNEQ